MGAARRKWTEEETATLISRKREPYEVLAEALGRPIGSVKARCNLLGLRPKQSERIPLPLDSAVQVPAVCIYERSIRYRIPPANLAAATFGDPKPGYTACDNNARKLSVQDAIEIGALYSGHPGDVIALAATYRTSTYTVEEIISGVWFDKLLPEHMRDNT